MDVLDADIFRVCWGRRHSHFGSVAPACCRGESPSWISPRRTGIDRNQTVAVEPAAAKLPMPNTVRTVADVSVDQQRQHDRRPEHDHGRRLPGARPASGQGIVVVQCVTGTPTRRFPAPWTVEEFRGVSFIVRDANRFAVAYVYFELSRADVPPPIS